MSGSSFCSVWYIDEEWGRVEGGEEIGRDMT